MAEQKSAEQEPSIEEILNSIRQIISDEEETPGKNDESAGDVIELTERADPPPEPVRETPRPAPIPQAVKTPDPVEIDMEEHKTEDPPMPQAEEPDTLLTRKAESAAYEGFSELARKTAVERDGITLEEIARTELKPLLRDWLNRNLPSLIERLVREELDRIAKKALED